MALDVLNREAGPLAAATQTTLLASTTEQQQQQQQRSSNAGADDLAARRHNRDDETPTPTLAPASAPAPAPKAETANLCGVCQTNPPKYKCPRCRLPYCSVACNKTHRENHPPDPEPQPQPPQAEPAVKLEASAEEPPDPANPFRALLTSDKLQMLFRKYPNLPGQLLEIHAATQPPEDAAAAAAASSSSSSSSSAAEKAIPASLMQGLPPRRDATWNHDVGIRNGKAALRRARRASGEAGEAIREYTELILHILNEAENKDAAATSYLRQQVAEEDTKLIQRLMAEEQRKR